MEDMVFVLKYINTELLIIAICLYCIGLFLKKAQFFRSEWAIPFIIWIFGVILTIVYMAFIVEGRITPEIFIDGFIQGTIISAVSVFANELIKQGLVKRVDDNDRK